MKKMLARLLSLLLCFVLVCGMLPALPVSALIKEEDGNYYYETFDDLKQLASQTYSDYTFIYYSGTEDLVISEDLTLPDNWDLDLYNEETTATIAEGVTLTVPPAASMDAHHLIVNGTLDIQSNIWVYGDLTVNGSMSISDPCTARFFGNTLTGYENISFGGTIASIQSVLQMETLEEAVSFINETVAKETRQIKYDITVNHTGRASLAESLTIPANCYLRLDCSALIIPKDCTLTVEGSLHTLEYCNLIVYGTLCNNGYMNLDFSKGRVLRFSKGSVCSGNGYMDVYVSSGDTATDVIQGVENIEYTLNYEDEYGTWYFVNMENASVTGFAYDGVSRIAGKTRYATSFAIADTLKQTLGVDRFRSIIVASGANFADALAGSFLATVKEAPILITDGKNYSDLCSYVEENLADDGMVYILGGNAAVPKQVEDALTSAGVEVKRLSGSTRFDTNVAILQEVDLSDYQTLLVCTGYDFADSLSASATGLPILLVNSTTCQLTDSQVALLRSMNPYTITIVGGEGAVDRELEYQLRQYTWAINRISGKNRYLTSVDLTETLLPGPEQAVVAYGRNFPDGLCGGPLAYFLNAPLLLTQAGSETAAAEYCTDFGLGGYVLGGDGVLTDETVRTVFGLEDDTVIAKK